MVIRVIVMATNVVMVTNLVVMVTNTVFMVINVVMVTRAAWFSGKIRDLLSKGCRFDSHSEKFSLIKEVNVPI